MPTYEYECGNCKHAFERFQMMTAKPVRKCPKCGKWSVKRLIGSGVGILFKGSGFYETDYKRKPQTSAEKKSPEKNSEPAGPASATKSLESGSASGGKAACGSSCA